MTKIMRKPKITGMEVKHLADCDSGIMMGLPVEMGQPEGCGLERWQEGFENKL